MITGVRIGPNFGIENLPIRGQMPYLPSLFASAAGLSLEMPVSGTDRLCRPLCKHFCYWKLSDGASARLILLSLTQSRPSTGMRRNGRDVPKALLRGTLSAS